MKRLSDPRIALLALIFILSILALVRVVADPRIPHSLTFERVEPSLPYLLFFKTFDIHDLTDALLFEPTKITGRLFPPLGYMLLAVFFALFGVGKGTIVFFNSICFAVSVFLLFQIGKKIGSGAAGILGAVIFSGFFVSIFFMQEFTLEIIVMPFLLFAFLLSLHDGIFLQTKPTLLAAGAIGIGTLVRQDVAAYLALPSAFLLFSAIRQMASQSKLPKLIARLIAYFRKHFLLVFAFALFSLGPYVIWFLLVRSRKVFEESFANDGIFVPGHSIYNMAFFLLIDIGPILVPVLFAGVFQYVRTRPAYPHRGYLHTFLFSAVVLLVFIKRSADPQHWLPVLPLVALVPALGLERIRTKSWKRFWAGAVLVLAGLSLFTISQSYLSLRLLDRLLSIDEDSIVSKSDRAVLLYVFDEALIKVNRQIPSRKDHVIGKIVHDIFTTPKENDLLDETILIDDTLLKASTFSNLYMNTAQFPYYAWGENPKRASKLRLRIGINLEQVDNPEEDFVLLGSHARGIETTLARFDSPQSRFRLFRSYRVKLPVMNLLKSDEEMEGFDQLGIAIRQAAGYYRKEQPVIWQDVTIYLYARKPGGQ